MKQQMLSTVSCAVDRPMILIGRFRAAAVTIAEHTVAAPPISALMASMPDEGFREIPPLE